MLQYNKHKVQITIYCCIKTYLGLALFSHIFLKLMAIQLYLASLTVFFQLLVLLKASPFSLSLPG